MEAFIRSLLQPGAWTETQWLAVSIGLFVLLASFYFVIRLYRIIRETGKSTYKPNIGLHRSGLRSPGLRPGQGAGQREGKDEGERPE